MRAIKLSAYKEPFDVDRLVTDADKLLSSAGIARVDSNLYQTRRVVSLPLDLCCQRSANKSPTAISHVRVSNGVFAARCDA